MVIFIEIHPLRFEEAEDVLKFWFLFLCLSQRSVSPLQRLSRMLKANRVSPSKPTIMKLSAQGFCQLAADLYHINSGNYNKFCQMIYLCYVCVDNVMTQIHYLSKPFPFSSFNSLWPGYVSISCRGIWSTLVRVMAWRQKGAKPLPKPILTYS